LGVKSIYLKDIVFKRGRENDGENNILEIP
jgi:hypothetical protein